MVERRVSPESFARDFLSRVRRLVKTAKLSTARLPPWVTSASVRIGRLPTSLLMTLDDSGHGDSFVDIGAVRSDLQVLLDYPEFEPVAACLPSRKDPDGGLLIVTGTYAQAKQTTLLISSERTALFGAGITGYHGPSALMNVFIRVAASASAAPLELQGAMTDALRFVPFALYVHQSDLGRVDALWRRCRQVMLDVLQTTAASDTGDYYESLERRFEVFRATKERTVVVLGKDSPPELTELLHVRDYLRSKDYDAWLIRQAPECRAMSNEEKVRLWAGAARFSVMVDRTPAGHIAEYMMLREQRSVLAYLRPRGRGSTFMIGDSHLADVNHIREFEFDQSPLECLDEAVQWAEAFIHDRELKYDVHYPWER